MGEGGWGVVVAGRAQLMEKLGKVLLFIQETVSVPIIAQDAGHKTGTKTVSVCKELIV